MWLGSEWKQCLYPISLYTIYGSYLKKSVFTDLPPTAENLVRSVWLKRRFSVFLPGGIIYLEKWKAEKAKLYNFGSCFLFSSQEVYKQPHRTACPMMTIFTFKTRIRILNDNGTDSMLKGIVFTDAIPFQFLIPSPWCNCNYLTEATKDLFHHEQYLIQVESFWKT